MRSPKRLLVWLYTAFLLLTCCATCTISVAPAPMDFAASTRQSFVKLERRYSIKICTKKVEGEEEKCSTLRFRTSASGAFVRTIKEGSYVLTAAHYCQTEDPNRFPLPPGMKVAESSVSDLAFTIDGRLHKDVQVLDLDESLDLCVMFVENVRMPSLHLALAQPRIGERVYNIAAPLGVSGKNFAPLFEGFYCGVDFNKHIYTIPATGGSSGSPITNSRGELVGMIHSVLANFRTVAHSPSLEELKTFISYAVDGHTVIAH